MLMMIITTYFHVPGAKFVWKTPSTSASMSLWIYCMHTNCYNPLFTLAPCLSLNTPRSFILATWTLHSNVYWSSTFSMQPFTLQTLYSMTCLDLPKLSLGLIYHMRLPPQTFLEFLVCFSLISIDPHVLLLTFFRTPPLLWLLFWYTCILFFNLHYFFLYSCSLWSPNHYVALVCV